MKTIALFLIVLLFAPFLVRSVTAGEKANLSLKPCRALVVIDIDWACDLESYVDSSAWAFHDIATLLKLWSIPFDVLRLDNNVLNLAEFVDPDGKAKYGVVIWNCRQDRFDPSQPDYIRRGTRDWSVLETAVLDYNISLICVGNTVLEPRIRSLLGISYLDLTNQICWYGMSDPFVITADHYITRGYNGTTIPGGDYGCRLQFNASTTTILGSTGAWPQLAVRDLSESTKAVWIGGNRDDIFYVSSVMGKILRRAITYCIGYSIYKTYPDTVLLRMDDSGSSQSAYLPSWSYAQLTEEQVISGVVQPLLQHNATLAVMYVPGYPRNVDRAILKSWTLDWIDPQGTRQNLTSDYLGLLNGISQGVLEIQSHGWTHMQPDLDSSPGPWWDNPGGTEWADERWYREFRDTRRGLEIDGATQELHLNNSIEYIEEAFGSTPLFFVAPGHEVSGKPSDSYVSPNYTYRLAALTGFGLASDGNGYYYLGPEGDMVISNMRMTRVFDLSQVSNIRARIKAANGWDIPVVAYFHDVDIAIDPSYLNNYLSQLESPNTPTEDAVQHYVSANEFIGYLHANVDALSSSLGFGFQYDEHYCTYFANHSSRWNLDLSDSLFEELRDLGRIDIIMDGVYNDTVSSSSYFAPTQELMVPSGIGRHTIEFTSTTRHDVAVVSLSLSSNVILVGSDVNVNVTVENMGAFVETFNVTAYYNASEIGTQTATDITPHTSLNLIFEWHTAGVIKGNYTIKVEASSVPDEVNLTNNVLVDGMIRIVTAPLADFTYLPSTPRTDFPVIFDASISQSGDGFVTVFEWHFGDGNVTGNGSPVLSHWFNVPGTYNVTLVVTNSLGLNASTWKSIAVISPGISEITIFLSANSRTVGFEVDINGTLMDAEQKWISDSTVVLSYVFPGISEWLPLTSAMTDYQGSYRAVWIPSITGYFTIKAEWRGNETCMGASRNTTLSVIPYDGDYVFTVISNSTISALSFNSTNLELSFLASGSSGTTGYSRAVISRTLVTNITELRAYLDGQQITYATSTTEDSWIINLAYSHSTHRIVVALASAVSSAPSFQTTESLLAIILTLLFAMLFVAARLRSGLSVVIRKRAPSAH